MKKSVDSKYVDIIRAKIKREKSSFVGWHSEVPEGIRKEDNLPSPYCPDWTVMKTVAFHPLFLIQGLVRPL